MYITLKRDGQELYLNRDGEFQLQKTIDLDYSPQDSTKYAKLGITRAEDSFDIWNDAKVVSEVFNRPRFYLTRNYANHLEYLTTSYEWSQSPLECLIVEDKKELSEFQGDIRRLTQGYGLRNDNIGKVANINKRGLNWLSTGMTLSPDEDFLKSFKRVMAKNALETLEMVKALCQPIINKFDTSSNLDAWAENLLAVMSQNLPSDEMINSKINQYEELLINQMNDLDHANTDSEMLAIAKQIKTLKAKKNNLVKAREIVKGLRGNE